MKTLDQWFTEYAESHQNQTNKKIHYICVPLIFMSVVGLLMSIPSVFVMYSWAFLILFLVSIFYFRLSIKMGIQVLVFALLCMIANHFIAQYFSLWKASLLIFALAWIGQFYGHKIEGEKPSFLKDLQFLLIGPAWVIHNLFNGK